MFRECPGGGPEADPRQLCALFPFLIRVKMTGVLKYNTNNVYLKLIPESKDGK